MTPGIFAVCSFLVLSLSVTSAADDFFPRFSDFHGQPYSVNFTKRAMTLNGSAALFLSGSVHPPRLSVEEWDSVMEDSVAAGLNMIEV